MRLTQGMLGERWGNACEGVVFTSVPLVKQLIERMTTRTGLRVSVDIIDKSMKSAVKPPST